MTFEIKPLAAIVPRLKVQKQLLGSMQGYAVVSQCKFGGIYFAAFLIFSWT